VEGRVVAISNVDAVAAILGVLIAGAVLVGSVFGFRNAFTYSFENSRLEIRILGVAIRRVSFSDIDQIEVIPFTALVPLSPSFRWDAFISWKWCGYHKRVVIIKTQSGVLKKIIVSPQDPEAFANSLRAVFSSSGS
jgi:hypothetical protein